MINTRYYNFNNINNLDSSRLINQLKQQINDLPALQIVQNQQESQWVQQIAADIVQYKNILIIGTGGSSLGAKTFCALKSKHHLIFLESIDNQTINDCFSSIDLEQTFFIVISKSGETVETVCQTLILLEKLQQTQNWRHRLLFITQDKHNSLASIAMQYNLKILPHNPQIGGRYSCFSIVGLLPAALCGLDVNQIVAGANSALQDFCNNPAIVANFCYNQLQFYNQGYNQMVLMPYIDKLKYFNDWFRQLFAESLGKEGFGITPINSTGTIDQHSQLQLYLDGKEDKMFTFIINKIDNDCSIVVPKSNTIFSQKSLQQILLAEAFSTIDLLAKKSIPIRVIEISDLNEYNLAKLMMQCFLETIFLANARNINPFDQPAVELRKQIARKILCQN
jgi:glucose-6-phosphate isomerase